MRMMVRKGIGWMEMEEVENIAASHTALGKVLLVIGKVSVIALYEFSSTYMIQFNSIKFVHVVHVSLQHQRAWLQDAAW